MQTYNVYCEGVSPLLMNQVTDDLLEELRTKNPRPKVRDLSRRDQAALCIYRETEDGPIGIPVTNLFSCLAEAGRDVPLGGMRKVSTAGSTKLSSILTIHELFMPLVLKLKDGFAPITDEGWVPDVRRGRNPKDGVMVAICRPRFDKWGFRFTADLDTDTANEAILRKLIEIGGRAPGLCDFRPGTKGQFGRFKIVSMKKIAGEETTPETEVNATMMSTDDSEGETED